MPPSPSMLSEPVAETRAWKGPTLARETYLVPIPDACMRELADVLTELRAAPVPTLLLLPEHFRLEACARFMADVRARLDEGPGFVIIDRFDLDRMSRPEAVDLYWILGNLLEPPVAQEWKGTVVYDVRHEGQAYTADTRGALTPAGLEMHTDSSMGEAPPNYVSLFCLQTAAEGGMSIVSSALAAHNHFLREAPGLLPRLYEPFYRDHQDYQAADAAATNFRPVFAWDGRLRTRFNARHTFRGYEKTGRTLDERGATAVRLMDEFLEDPANRLDLWLEAGQIQILNNRVIVHGRTPYRDHDEPERRRHLVRLWLRAGDRRHFRG
ncbi:MAG TPA: TauD/TfdA family dioxygenase [Candidatus Bathyarchaeia archaeon]|nr:TauD/TfdA family dioxygenase [Candidatus Bathyarchaeia archaeon]